MSPDPDKLDPVPRFETVDEATAKARGMKPLTRGFGVRKRKSARLLQTMIAGLTHDYLLVAQTIAGRGTIVTIWK